MTAHPSHGYIRWVTAPHVTRSNPSCHSHERGRKGGTTGQSYLIYIRFLEISFRHHARLTIVQCARCCTMGSRLLDGSFVSVARAALSVLRVPAGAVGGACWRGWRWCGGGGLGCVLEDCGLCVGVVGGAVLYTGTVLFC